MNETVGFEWTKKGEKLLESINELIDKYGGSKRLAYDIESEWIRGRSYKPPRFIKSKIRSSNIYWTESEIDFLHNNRHLRAWQIGRKLKRTVKSVQQMRIKSGISYFKKNLKQ